MDEWWLQVEPHLIERFKTRRAAGAVVLRSHLLVWTIEICYEIGIDLKEMKVKRQWKNFKINLRQRIERFLEREKITEKRASRQAYKNPKVKLQFF